MKIRLWRGLIASWLLLGAAEVSGGESFMQSFTQERSGEPMVMLTSRGAAKYAKLTPEGYLFSLPAGQAHDPAAGLLAQFRARGDFEITATYEIVEHDSPSMGYGSGASLCVIAASNDAATVARVDHPKRGQVIATDRRGAPAADGKARHHVKMVPATNDSGKLQLIREGGTLRYLATDVEGELKEIRRESFVTYELTTIRLSADTGGSNGALHRALRRFIGAGGSVAVSAHDGKRGQRLVGNMARRERRGGDGGGCRDRAASQEKARAAAVCAELIEATPCHLTRNSRNTGSTSSLRKTPLEAFTVDDALAGAAWFAVNWAAISAAWRLTRRVWPEDMPSQIAMHALIVFWASIVGVSVIAGSLNVFDAVVLGAMLLLLSAGVHAGLSLTTARAPKARLPQLWTKASVSAWGPLAALGGGIIADRLLGFPEQWDDLMYHLPLIDHWLQGRSLYVPRTVEWYNPGACELIGAWSAAPFSGDFWVGAANLPMIVLLALATVEIGGLVGLTPLASHAASVATLSTNVVLRQLVEFQNDATASGLFAAGLGYGIRYARNGRRGDMWMSAVSLALLCGVKYYALGYAVLAALAVVLMAFVERGIWASLRLLATGLIAGLLLSGYWYLRNWTATGTPVYPLGFSAATNALDSLRPGWFQSTFLGNGRAGLWLQYFEAVWDLAGPCQTAAVALAPAAMLWLVANRLIGRQNAIGRRDARLRTFLALLLAASVFIFSITPFTVDSEREWMINRGYTVVRYSQCSLLLAVVVLGIVLSDVSRAIDRLQWNSRMGAITSLVPGIMVMAAVVWQLVLRCREVVDADALLFATTIATAGWTTYRLWRLQASRGRRAVWLAAAMLLVGFAGASAGLSRHWHAGFARNYDRQFATHAFTPRSPSVRIAAGRRGELSLLPLFRLVSAISRQRPYQIASRMALYAYLSENEIDYLSVIRRDPFKYGRYRGVGDWIAEDTAAFEKIDSGSDFDVYRIETRTAEADVASATEQ